MKRVLAIFISGLGVLILLIFTAEPLRADPLTITPKPPQASVLEGLPAAFMLTVTNTSGNKFITVTDVFAGNATFVTGDPNDAVSLVKTTDIGCSKIRLGPGGSCIFAVLALTQDLHPELSGTNVGVWRIPVFALGVFDGDPTPISGNQDVFVIVQDPVPEPGTMLLLGTGLAGVAIKTQKKLKSRKSRQGTQ